MERAAFGSYHAVEVGTAPLDDLHESGLLLCQARVHIATDLFLHIAGQQCVRGKEYACLTWLDKRELLACIPTLQIVHRDCSSTYVAQISPCILQQIRAYADPHRFLPAYEVR